MAIPSITNWSVTPQNGQDGYFTKMNTWLFESTTVISSANTSIDAMNVAIEDVNNIALNAINVITLNTIAELTTYEGSGYTVVKDLGRGGQFVSKLSTDINPKTGLVYEVDNKIVFAKAGGGFWVRLYFGGIDERWGGSSTETNNFSSSLGILDAIQSNQAVSKYQLDNLAQAITIDKSLAIIMIGQSNALSRSPKVTTQYPTRLKTFNLGSQHGDYSSGNIENATPESKMSSLIPFSEFARNEESWGAGLAYALNQYRYDEIMFYSAAIGSRAYRKLKSGNGVYGEMLVADRNFRSLAKHQIVDRLYILDHGEADAVGIEPTTLLPETPVSKTNYLSIITQWRENIITDTKLQQGNSSLDVPIFLISSMNYAGVNIETTTSYKQVQNAQLEAGLTISGVYMIGAKYQFDFESDQIHITGLGKRFYSEKAGHVYNKILINGFWKPMHIETVSSPNANTVLATFYIPEDGNLVIDTVTTKSTELTHTGSKYGFELFQDGVKNPITNVTVSGKVATITTQNAISGAVKELRIAQLNSTGTALSENKNRSNVRSDSNIQTSIHDSSVKLYDWAVPQSKLL